MSNMVFFIVLLAIPIFFLVNWTSKRFIAARDARAIFSIVITVFAIPMIYVGLVIGLITYTSYEPQHDFNQDRWISAPNHRYSMQEDLVESELLLNQSKTEVLQLIGEPTTNTNDHHWRYDLGMSSGTFMGWTFNYLEVQFDNDRVTDVELIEVQD